MDNLIPSSSANTDEPEAADFVYGAENIAKLLRVSVRKVYYFMERRKLGKSHVPINYVPGAGLCGSRKALIDHMKGQRQV